MGQTLFFLRHGRAESREGWRGDDAERPLTAEGERRMAREAAGIRALGLALDLIVTSPLVRARRTAEIVAAGHDNPPRIVEDERLGPGFGPAHLAEILADHRHAAALMLVGHEPDFSETIRQVTGGGRVVMKKGSLACVQLDDLTSLHGALVWLIPPKALER